MGERYTFGMPIERPEELAGPDRIRTWHQRSLLGVLFFRRSVRGRRFAGTPSATEDRIASTSDGKVRTPVLLLVHFLPEFLEAANEEVVGGLRFDLRV